MKRRTVLLGCLTVALVISGILYFRGLGELPKRQAILILLDAARWDRFMYAGYEHPTTPRMYELGAQGVTSNKHFAQSTHTRESLPGMIYSRYFSKPIFPGSSQIAFAEPRYLMRRIDDEAISLPRALQAEGFKTAAVSAHPWIRPETPFAKEFEEFYSLAGELLQDDQGTDEAIGRAKIWIQSHRGDDYFLYVHLMETHFPHRFDRDAKVFFDGSKYPRSSEVATTGNYPKDTSRALKGDDRRYLDAIYNGSLRRVDRQIGRLVDFLRDEGLFDDTLIVITSDHGEHLLEVPDRIGHGGKWFDLAAQIPLIISYPGRVTPRRLNSFSELVDIAPTIMGLLEIDWPKGKTADGVNLREVLEGKIAARPFAVSPSGLRTEKYKLIIGDRKKVLSGSSIPSPIDTRGRLYDLSQDPLELEDLWCKRPEIATRLVEKYRDALSYAYKRFKESVNHEQPSNAFAIASRYFDSDMSPTRVEHSLDQEGLLAIDSENGWFQSRDWKNHWLLATNDAAPLKISFPIPNGRYQVSVKIAGAAQMTLLGKDPVEVHGPELLNFAETTGEVVQIGMTDVSEEEFHLRIVPDGESRFRIQLVGFDPIPPGAIEAAAIDKRLLEQLRTLGYLE